MTHLSYLSHLVIRQEGGQQQINPEDCTLQTCPLELATIEYVPSLAGNALYVAIFGLILLIQVFLGIRYRTWGFFVGLVAGVALEIVGYGARISMHFNPFPEDPFLIQIVCLTIAPAFITAAIYLCLARIVVVYGEDFSRLKPRTYSILFVSLDVISLVLQALGGGMASTAETPTDTQRGVDIMIAGLAFQVAALLLFMVLCLDFARRAYRNRGRWNPAHASLQQTVLWKAFLISLAIATLTIFIRSVFRVAELSEGFDGHLANDQVTFMILEGAMLIIACIVLTALHPGIAFQGNYSRANFSVRGRRIQPKQPTTSPGDFTPDEELQAYRG